MVFLPFFLARRFFTSITTSSTMKTVLLTCFISFTLSSCSLALVAAIMKGFEDTTKTKFQGIHPDLMIQAPTQSPLKYEIIASFLSKNFPDLIVSTSGYAHQYGIIFDEKDTPHMIQVQGFEPKNDTLTRPLHTFVTSKKTLSTILQPSTCILGTELAKSLNITPGDTLTLTYIPNLSGSTHPACNTATLTLADTCTTGIDEYDRSFLFCSLETFEEIFQQSPITLIGLKVHPNSTPNHVRNKIAQELPLHIFSWEELYPALLSALTLESYAMIFIFTLITLVASMNIISLLFMNITQHQGTIAIMRTMGMPTRSIQSLFIILGTSIAFTASTLGIAIAWIISWMLEHFQLIQLPDAYYTSYLPAHMSLSTGLLVLIISSIVSLGASYWGTRNLKHMDLTHILKDTL